MSLLEMRHIKKQFENLEVLKDISLTVNEGEVLSIIGPSGSGKSTLLRCATLLEKIDDGDIFYMEEAAAQSKNGSAEYARPADLKRIHGYFGLVFQNFNLFPHYSVMKNITDAPIRVQKRKKEEVYEEARALLKKMGLEDKGDAYPYQLSGGQQQRVSIARALAMYPKILGMFPIILFLWNRASSWKKAHRKNCSIPPIPGCRNFLANFLENKDEDRQNRHKPTDIVLYKPGL